jgi:hypothetical protein
MEEVSDTARRPAIALRLIFGSLAATAGLLLLGAVLNSPSASAADPAPDSPSLLSGISSAGTSLDGTLSSVVDETTSAVGAIVSPVTAVLPAPVSTVLSSVTPAVDSVAQSGVVSQIVSPVAGTVDDVIGAIPGVNNLLGSNPVSSITDPTTGLADGAIGFLVGTVAGVIGPATGYQPNGSDGSIGGTLPGGWQNVSEPWNALNVAELTTSATAFGSHATVAGFASVAGVMALGSPVSPRGELDLPSGPPFAVSPPGTSGASSGPGSGPGGTSSSADAASASNISGPAAGTGGTSENDVLPSSPASNHDSSPD